ncbi:MAG: T9SS type A sorting domain-containing protein [Bacteroidetes bacterium]|jgi:uncharacterized protein (DUF2141 family)|nr:T9SS type A sorting domain-containing protein [Bacteroidota bacterium]
MLKNTPFALYAFFVKSAPYLCWVLFFVFAINENNLAQIKIVPIGNSITQGDAGSPGANSYRRDLWNLLNNAGYNVDFVGSKDSPINGSHPDPNFDHHHEGHYGWRADEIKDNIANWLTFYDTPDIALIHIGTNDIRDDQSTSGTVDDISGIIDILRNENANITIFLAQIIPSIGWIDDGGTQITSLNQALVGFAGTKSTVTSPVILVDHHTGWDIDIHCYDYIHPNTAGEARMAQTWFDALDDYLTPCNSPSINLTQTNVSCNGDSDGLISASVSGGSSPYTLNWSNGGTGNQISSLQAGNYTVTAIDANNCTAQATTTITEPEALTATAMASDESAVGANDGSVDLTVSGGTMPYTFNWSNGATSEDIGGLAPGNYSVTVTDDRGCQATASSTVGSPDCSGFSVSIDPTHITCYGENDGTAHAMVAGGQGTPTYNWSNGGTGNQISSLQAGNYTVTAIDANNCTAQATITIDQPAELDISVSVNHESLRGLNDGNITLTIYNGSGPYTFQWSNGENKRSIDSLSPGIYAVTVTDDNGCEGNASIKVNQGKWDCNGYNISSQKSDISCFGNQDGKAQVQVSGGQIPYSYNWSNGDTSNTVSNLSSGEYFVTVVDQHACRLIDTIHIQEPEKIDVSMNITHVTSSNAADGRIELTLSGGVPPYSFLWSNRDTTSVINNLSDGSYIVRITDDNNCTVNAEGIIENSTVTHLHNRSFNVSVYPNPTNKYLIFNGLNISSKDDIIIELIGIDGKKHNIQYNYTIKNESIIIYVHNLAIGVYVVRIKYSNTSFTTLFGKE